MYVGEIFKLFYYLLGNIFPPKLNTIFQSSNLPYFLLFVL